MLSRPSRVRPAALPDIAGLITCSQSLRTVTPHALWARAPGRVASRMHMRSPQRRDAPRLRAPQPASPIRGRRDRMPGLTGQIWH